MKFCGSCGEKLDENALVCEKCGAPQKSIAPLSAGPDIGFKKPGQYDAEPAREEYRSIKVQSSAPPPSWSGSIPEGEVVRIETIRTEPVTLEVEDEDERPAAAEEKPGEHSCSNCSGALIYSLARGLWFCPACGTEAPNLPSPYGDEDEEEEDEAETQTQDMLAGRGPSDLPAGPLPDMKGAGARPRKFDKPPEEVDGVTMDAAKESIIEIQNLIDAKIKSGLYSVEAESFFDSMKVAFTEYNYPAVIQLNRQTKDIIARAEAAGAADERARPDETMPMGGKRQQAINALQASRDTILEAEKLGYDLTESKKIYKQAEPAYRAGDYETVINFAHDVEESVNAVLGGKRLAKAPTFQPRPGGLDGPDTAEARKVSWFEQNKEIIFKYVLPVGGLILLILGASIAYISYMDNIWNPFSDGPDDWGPYNTIGVILGIVAVIVGLMFAILPFLLTKKVTVRMEPPKPVQMQQ